MDKQYMLRQDRIEYFDSLSNWFVYVRRQIPLIPNTRILIKKKLVNEIFAECYNKMQSFSAPNAQQVQQGFEVLKTVATPENIKLVTDIVGGGFDGVSNFLKKNTKSKEQLTNPPKPQKKEKSPEPESTSLLNFLSEFMDEALSSTEGINNPVTVELKTVDIKNDNIVKIISELTTDLNKTAKLPLNSLILLKKYMGIVERVKNIKDTPKDKDDIRNAIREGIKIPNIISKISGIDLEVIHEVSGEFKHKK